MSKKQVRTKNNNIKKRKIEASINDNISKKEINNSGSKKEGYICCKNNVQVNNKSKAVNNKIKSNDDCKASRDDIVSKNKSKTNKNFNNFKVKNVTRKKDNIGIIKVKKEFQSEDVNKVIRKKTKNIETEISTTKRCQYEFKEKKKMFITLLIATLLLIAVIGFSYAYFVSQINMLSKDNTKTDVSANGIVNVSLDVKEKIVAENIFPGYKMSKEITLKGSGKSGYKSVVATIIIRPNLGVFTGDVVWHLYKSSTEITCTNSFVSTSSGVYDDSSCAIPSTATMVLEGDSQYKKYKVNVDYNTNDNYYLVVEYLNRDEDQSNQMNEAFNIDVDLIKYDSDNVIGEIDNSVKFSMNENVAGISVNSLGDDTYEINGTSTEMINIRLSDYFKTSVLNANKLYDSNNPNESVIMKKGHSYNIDYEYISGSNNLSKFNTFRLCFAIPNSYAGLETFGYDFKSGFFGNHRLVQDVGMYFLWIDKNISFDHFQFKIKIIEVSGDGDNDNVSIVKNLSYGGTSISAVWYDSGYIEVFGYNDLTDSNRTTVYINLNDFSIDSNKSAFYQEKYVTSPPYKSGTKVKMVYQNYRNGPSVDKTLDYNNQIYFQFVDTASSASILLSPSIDTENNDLTSTDSVTVSGTLKKDAISPLLIIGSSVNFKEPWKFKMNVDTVK